MTHRRPPAPGRASRSPSPRRPLDPVASVLVTLAWVAAGTLLAVAVLAARCDAAGLYVALAVLVGSGWLAVVESEKRSDSGAMQAAWIRHRLRRPPAGPPR